MSSLWGQSSVIYCFSGAKRKEIGENNDTILERSNALNKHEESSQSEIVQNISPDKFERHKKILVE